MSARLPRVTGAAALALTLGACAPETVTPLRATDGEPPARDRAVELDETVTPRDAERDRGSSDADCPLDGGAGEVHDGACVTDGGVDTQSDMPSTERRRPAAGAD